MSINEAPQSRRSRGRSAFLAGETEARPGIITTEYWIMTLAAATVVVAGYVSDAFSIDLAWSLFAGIIASYVISRGLAKCGSREGPFVIGGADREQTPRT
jgi:hypothetical protein